jgi:hypothetical protein
MLVILFDAKDLFLFPFRQRAQPFHPHASSGLHRWPTITQHMEI